MLAVYVIPHYSGILAFKGEPASIRQDSTRPFSN